MWGDSKYGAQIRYDEYNTTQVKLKLNYKTDADVIKWINRHKASRDSSVQGAIKALIWKELEEADESCHENWVEIEHLRRYIDILQKSLKEHGIDVPPEC
jgi:hypothetical protein